jgi:hypothetical protein
MARIRCIIHSRKVMMISHHISFWSKQILKLHNIIRGCHKYHKR